MATWQNLIIFLVAPLSVSHMSFPEPLLSFHLRWLATMIAPSRCAWSLGPCWRLVAGRGAAEVWGTHACHVSALLRRQACRCVRVPARQPHPRLLMSLSNHRLPYKHKNLWVESVLWFSYVINLWTTITNKGIFCHFTSHLTPSLVKVDGSAIYGRKFQLGAK